MYFMLTAFSIYYLLIFILLSCGRLGWVLLSYNRTSNTRISYYTLIIMKIIKNNNNTNTNNNNKIAFHSKADHPRTRYTDEFFLFLWSWSWPDDLCIQTWPKHFWRCTCISKVNFLCQDKVREDTALQADATEEITTPHRRLHGL